MTPNLVYPGWKAQFFGAENVPPYPHVGLRAHPAFSAEFVAGYPPAPAEQDMPTRNAEPTERSVWIPGPGLPATAEQRMPETIYIANPTPERFFGFHPGALRAVRHLLTNAGVDYRLFGSFHREVVAQNLFGIVDVRPYKHRFVCAAGTGLTLETPPLPDISAVAAAMQALMAH